MTHAESAITFASLQAGDWFEFDHSGLPLTHGLESGPWQKISARQYEKSGVRAMRCRIGSTSARVVRVSSPVNLTSLLCTRCNARTTTPATLPDGSTVCQLCGVEANTVSAYSPASPDGGETSLHARTERARVERALAATFGAEWDALNDSDRALIVRDCTTDGGIDDFAEYRRNIGPGNLERYALTQRVRFRRLDEKR
jgi:hypothetical protein